VSNYTVLDDTFTGTTGSAITGQHGSPVACGSDAYQAISGVSAPVYKAGGGVTSATLTGGAALIVHPLTGVARDLTSTLKLVSAVGPTSATSSQGSLYIHRDGVAGNYVSIALDFGLGQLIFLQGVSGAPNHLAGSPYSGVAFVAGRTYTLTLTAAGTTFSFTLNDGTSDILTGSSDSPSGGNQPAVSAAGGEIVFGQVAGAAGDITITEINVVVAGPTTAAVAGPTSLTVGSLSTLYTIAPGSAVPAGGQGIAFAPAVSGFSATPTPSTVTLPPGATTGTFAITPSTTGSGSVSATSSGITVTGQSGVTSASGSLTAGTATAGSVTSTTAAATATDATGGTSPYTYQWYRSTGSGTLGSAVSGQTTRTLADTGLTASTTYYYTLRYTDAAGSPAHADSNQITMTTSAGSTPSLAISPTTATATDGGSAVSITATRANSSASLAASVSGGGTLSTSAPTSGVAFTWTPPSSGSGTATVTVTDTTDSLTRTCTITYAPAAPAPAGDELEVRYPVASLNTVYFQVGKAPGKAWNGTAFETATAAHWASYAIAAAGSDAGVYLADFPPTIPVGAYTAYAYLRLGGSAAFGDPMIAEPFDGIWDGSSFAAQAGGLTSDQVAALLDPLRGFPAARGGDARRIRLAAGTGTDIVGQDVVILGGTGVDQVRTIVAYDPSTGWATVDEDWATPPDTTSIYALAPAGSGVVSLPNSSVTLDGGTVTWSPQPSNTTTFYATADGLTGATGAYVGMAVRFTTPGKTKLRRGITTHTFAGGVHYFTLAGPPLPAGPAAGDTFVIE
jgi:hypothetical protein